MGVLEQEKAHVTWPEKPNPAPSGVGRKPSLSFSGAWVSKGDPPPVWRLSVSGKIILMISAMRKARQIFPVVTRPQNCGWRMVRASPWKEVSKVGRRNPGVKKAAAYNAFVI